MFEIIRARIHQKHRTIRYPEAPPPPVPDRFRGRPLIDAARCPDGCRLCADACPVGAISFAAGNRPVVDLGRCLFCNDCKLACPQNAIRHSDNYRLSTRCREHLVLGNEEAMVLAESLGGELKRLLGRSLKLRQVSAGGCNACEADVNVLGTVGWDLGRFGIQFVASPRHADGLLITGPVTQNMKSALLDTYEAVAKPKIVIAVGACAIAGGPFIDHPEVNNGAGSVLPVDLYIPGCPPHPLTILDGLLRLLGRVDDRKTATKGNRKMNNRKTINQLIQLQELIVAHMQTKAAQSKVPLDALEKSIALLGADLEKSVKDHVNRLLQKNPEAVVTIVDNHCTGCGMQLPVSLVNDVHRADNLHKCPNCARFLYYPSEVVARERTSRVYGEKLKIGIARFSAPSLMVAPLTGTTPEEVLREMCQRLQQESFITSADQLLDLALQREAIVSTAVDGGIAFPHVRGVEGGGLTLALGVHKKGIHFGGPGRALTRIFFFMVIPTATSAFYLKLLSGLSETFREPTARDALLAAVQDPEELWKTLVKLTRKTVK